MSLFDAVESSEPQQLAERQEMEESGEEEESEEEGSFYSDEEETDESGSEEEGDDEEDEDEPVLKYKRFAKEVVNALHQSQDGESKNVIQCMAVHPKVCIVH